MHEGRALLYHRSAHDLDYGVAGNFMQAGFYGTDRHLPRETSTHIVIARCLCRALCDGDLVNASRVSLDGLSDALAGTDHVCFYSHCSGETS
jgi:hypothetical protein